ncbi:nucleotidyltransferase domain-containing protein [Nonomuraea sp. NPDC050556]|uniref:nucleotidyltransferase domain-containing protein n=1 Tax=Nonomuraea sp. NPDC050556 TaxID=3364369 RepID=UPI0037A7C928
MRTETPWGPWEPASLTEVVALLQGLEASWWVSGGYAIELAVGRSFREHGDVDISVLRRDQLAMRRHLAGWDVQLVDSGEFRLWEIDEVLPEHVHDIWIRETPDGPWRFQLMVDEADGAEWIYRRDARIRRPLASLGIAEDGFVRLSPEVQLLFKSKARRPKDEQDFAEVLPVLTGQQRLWLDQMLAIEFGTHPWRDRLRG